MGDRANIVVKAGGEQVCFYAHWDGSELPKKLRSALSRGRDRLKDFQYLNRIIFCEMIGDDKEATGYGISQEPWDGKDRVILVDLDAESVTINKSAKSISEFMRSPSSCALF